jgi:hypothetical protein
VRSSTELKFGLGLHILRIVWLPKHLHQRKQGFISYVCKQHIVTHNGEKCFKEACECQQNWWSTELLLPPIGFGSGGRPLCISKVYVYHYNMNLLWVMFSIHSFSHSICVDGIAWVKINIKLSNNIFFMAIHFFIDPYFMKNYYS